MMIDYNVSDHWTDDIPAWLKSLVSSLDRRHGVSSVLPLTVIVERDCRVGAAGQWHGCLAAQPENRESLRFDLEQSAAAMGPSLRSEIAAPWAAFEAAFSRLISSPRATLGTAPGTRTDAAWIDAATTT